MSSSTSGQWIPCPDPISRKLARWAGVASERRHDQARGTLMTRPSARDATISSFVTRTSRIRGSAPAAVVIPCLHDLLVMLPNDLTDPSVRVLQTHGSARASTGPARNDKLRISRAPAGVRDDHG